MGHVEDWSRSDFKCMAYRSIRRQVFVDAVRLLKRMVGIILYPLRRYLMRLVRRKTGCVVRSGPFQGLKYANGSIGSVYIPKLLGIYERELHPVIEEIAAKDDLDAIVNIGAGEGYYSVGLAARTGIPVKAFEMSQRGQLIMAAMAASNSVSGQIEIFGRCEPEILQQVLSSISRALIICDVEGYEAELLDVRRVPQLSSSPILVELHDFVCGDVTQLIRHRFCNTHRITHVIPQERNVSEYPFTTIVTRLLPEYVLARLTVHEGRPTGVSWFWMNPKNRDLSERHN